jgi:hypothetical protein
VPSTVPTAARLKRFACSHASALFKRHLDALNSSSALSDHHLSIK